MTDIAASPAKDTRPAYAAADEARVDTQRSLTRAWQALDNGDPASCEAWLERTLVNARAWKKAANHV